MRIDVVVILNVVLVARRRDKNRVQVQNFNTKLAQIVEFLDHARKVSAVKFLHILALRRTVPVRHALGITVDIVIFAGLHIVGRIAVAEAVDENLVHDRALRPVRRVESRRNPETHRLAVREHHTEPVVAEHAVLRGHLEEVVKRLVDELHLGPVPVKPVIALIARHIDAARALLDHNRNAPRLILPDAQLYGHGVIGLRLAGRAEHLRPVREDGLRLKRFFHLCLCQIHNNIRDRVSLFSFKTITSDLYSAESR